MFQSITHPQQRAFLSAYAECGVVKEAAELAGIARDCHYDWLRSHAEYADAWERARELAADLLEDEARRRGRIERSDKMLMFLLERLKPKQFGRKIEHTGEVTHAHTVDWAALSDQELEELERIASKARAIEPPSDSRGAGPAAGEQAGADVPADGSAEA